jgi:ATP-dependent protease ClpP protease subunit/predicted DNA-binding WGR domain protein
MAFLTRIDPTRNIDRFYIVDVTPTLFGEWAVVREWGRRRSPGHHAPRELPAARRGANRRVSAAETRHKMIRPIAAALAVIFFAATKPVAAEVLIDTRPEGIGIVINGLITRETGFEVVRAIADIPQNHLKDVVYVLNSPGGSPVVAFDIAKAIADTSSFAMIQSGSECASACFLMLAAAKSKLMAPDALIAVHSARTEGRGEDWDALATTAGMGKILSRYGIPAAIIGKMVSTPASEIMRLTVAEMQSLPGAEIRGGGMRFQDFTRNAVPVDEYRAGLTAGKLIAAHMAWAGNRCDFVSSRFQAGCLDGLRHP